MSVSTALIVTIIVVIVVVILLLAIFFAARRSRARRQEQQRERGREGLGSGNEGGDEAQGADAAGGRGGRARRQEQQRERSREEFGSEYERTAQEKGSEEEAERELRRRRGSVERNIEPLPDERRDHFEAQWGEVERAFVENPEKSIEMADRTVSDILHERRFVTDSSQSDEETEKNLAVVHPDVADDYREARRMRADAVARPGGGPPGAAGAT